MAGMAREKGRKLVAQNRKARHDYHIDDTYEAGLVLMGTEVKSLRAGRATLTDGFADRIATDDGFTAGAEGPVLRDAVHRLLGPEADESGDVPLR